MGRKRDNDGLVLPCDVTAERFVIGGLFAGSKRQPDLYPAVAEVVRPESFSLPKHGLLFRAMGEVFGAGLTINAVTVLDVIDKRGQREMVGSFLDLVGGMPEVLNLASYCRIVAEKALLREIYVANMELQEAILREESPVEVLAQAQRSMARLSVGSDESRGIGIEQVIERAGGINPFLSPETNRGLMTPWPRFNELTNGLKPGELIILGARTGIGKTSAALQIAAHAALHGHRVRYESHEMPPAELGFRLVCAEAGIDSHDVRMGNLSMGERCNAQEAASKLIANDDFLVMSEKPIKTCAGLAAMLRRQRSEGRPIKILVVDLLQRMHGMGAVTRRNLEIAQIAEGLKEVAMSEQIPVLALAQLKTIETKEQYKHDPTADDFSESKAIGEASDMSLIFRLKDAEQFWKPERLVNLYIVKQRNGPTAYVPFYFVAAHTRFVEIPRSGVGAAA